MHWLVFFTRFVVFLLEFTQVSGKIRGQFSVMTGDVQGILYVSLLNHVQLYWFMIVAHAKSLIERWQDCTFSFMLLLTCPRSIPFVCFLFSARETILLLPLVSGLLHLPTIKVCICSYICTFHVYARGLHGCTVSSYDSSPHYFFFFVDSCSAFSMGMRWTSP